MEFDIFTFKENELYGSEMPETQEDFEKIKKLNIKVIISFDETIKEVKEKISVPDGIEFYEIFITDMDVPEKHQVERFLKLITKLREEKKPVLVHCIAGCGRTGLMLALAEKYIYGVIDGKKAIENVRKVRPCALETPNQIDFVINY